MNSFNAIIFFKSEIFQEITESINPFATGDVYMRQLFHCLQWYVGSERVNNNNIYLDTHKIKDNQINK